MKKSLIALLVAGIPAAAFADVTIYGAIKGGVETVDNGAQTQTNIDDLGSRIGFKGNEDLGNGLKAIWQVETGFNTDTGSGTGSASGNFANRQSFIGLASDFGTVRLGNINNFNNDVSVIDPWEYNSATLGLGMFTRDNGRIKNAIRIDTPEWNGFKAAVAYGAKEDRSDVASNFHNGQNFNGINADGTVNSTEYTVKSSKISDDRNIFNIGLSYENSGYFGTYSYIQEGAQSLNGSYTTGTGSAAVTKKFNSSLPKNVKNMLEAGYSANNLFVAFGFKNSKGDASVLPYSTYDSKLVFQAPVAVVDGKTVVMDKKFESNEYALTGAYTMGRFTPKASFAMASDVKYDGDKLSDSGYTQFVVGVDYALSKRTTLGAQYGYTKFDGKDVAEIVGLPTGQDKVNAYGVSLVHKF